MILQRVGTARPQTAPCSAPPCSSVPTCRRPPAHRLVLTNAASGVARKPAARKAPIQPDPVAPDSLFELDTRIQTLPDDIIGPVTVSVEPGHRALVATRNLTTGELLMVTNPVIILRSSDMEPEGGEGEEEAQQESAQDEGEEEIDEEAPVKALIKALTEKKYSPRELELLKVLRTADAAAEAVDLASIQQLDNTDQSAPLPESYTPELLQKLLELNVHVAMSEDVAICALTDTIEAPGIMGLWPQVNLMAHSCSPNTVTYIVGGKQITRASRPGISKGTELTRPVLANILVAPLADRQEFLEKEQGFKCMCQRCVAETAVPAELTNLIREVYVAANELRPDIEEAAASNDPEKLTSIKDRLGAYVQSLDAAFEQHQPSQQTQLWLQASLFDLYEAIFTCIACSSEYEPRITELLSVLAAAVHPGSEQHVYWAYMHLRQVEEMCMVMVAQQMEVTELSEEVIQNARKMEEFKTADQLCFKAHCARYGRITPPVYRSILDAVKELEAQSMEALAANEGEEGEEQEGEEGEGYEPEDDSDVVDVKSEPVTPRKP